MSIIGKVCTFNWKVVSWSTLDPKLIKRRVFIVSSNFRKRDFNTGVFLSCKIFKNVSYRTSPVAASILSDMKLMPIR